MDTLKFKNRNDISQIVQGTNNISTNNQSNDQKIL